MIVRICYTKNFNTRKRANRKLYEHSERFQKNAIVIEAGAFSGRDVKCVHTLAALAILSDFSVLVLYIHVMYVVVCLSCSVVGFFAVLIHTWYTCTHMDAREHRHGTKNNLPSLLGNFMLLVGTNYWQFVNLRREQNRIGWQ